MSFAEDFAKGFASGSESVFKYGLQRSLLKDKDEDKEKKLNLQITKELNAKFLGEYPEEAGKYKWDYVDNKHELWDIRGKEPIRVPEGEVTRIFGKSNLEAVEGFEKKDLRVTDKGKIGVAADTVRVPAGGPPITIVEPGSRQELGKDVTLETLPRKEELPPETVEVSQKDYAEQSKREQERHKTLGSPSTPQELRAQEDKETSQALESINKYYVKPPDEKLRDTDPNAYAQQSQLNAMYNQGFLRFKRQFGPVDALNKISEVHTFLTLLPPEEQMLIMPEMQKMLITGDWGRISDVMGRIGMNGLKGLGMEQK